MEYTKEQRAWVEKEVYVICPIQINEDNFCAKRKKKINDLREQIKDRLYKKCLEKMPNNKFSGVTVNTDHPSIIGQKTIGDLGKLGLFSHLSKDESDLALIELWDYLHPKKEIKKEEDTV